MSTRPCLTPLEPRLLMAASDPSANEQYMLELLNRARVNPAAELTRLLGSTDKDVKGEFAFYNVNRSTLSQQWSSLRAVPPLAWSGQLRTAADSHDALMVQKQDQQFLFPGEPTPAARADTAGYDADPLGIGENVYAFARTPLEAHATLMVGWTNTSSTGLFDPPYTRQSLMSAGYRQIGIAVRNAPAGNRLGPLVVTEDLASPVDTTPYLLGVVFNDNVIADRFYTPGEGIEGLLVTATRVGDNQVFTTLTTKSGGYQLHLPSGNYNVTVAGEPLDKPFIANGVVISEDNVKADFFLSTPAAPGQLPDLAVKLTTPPTGTIAPGATKVPVTIKVTNNGPAYTGPLGVTVYLSKNKTIEASDPHLPTVTLPVVQIAAKSNKSYTFNAGPLLAIAPPGGYYTLVRIDAPADTNDANDTVSSAATSKVVAPVTNLLPTFVGAPVVKNGKVVFSLSVKNAGNVPAVGRGTFTVTARPANGRGADVPLGTLGPLNLNVGIGRLLQTFAGRSMPVGSLAPGAYKLVISLASTLTTPESNAKDNTTTSAAFAVR